MEGLRASSGPLAPSAAPCALARLHDDARGGARGCLCPAEPLKTSEEVSSGASTMSSCVCDSGARALPSTRACLDFTAAGLDSPRSSATGSAQPADADSAAPDPLCDRAVGSSPLPDCTAALACATAPAAAIRGAIGLSRETVSAPMLRHGATDISGGAGAEAPAAAAAQAEMIAAAARQAELDAAAAAALRPGRVRPLMAIAAETIVSTSLDSLTAEVLASIPEPMAFLIFALVIKRRRLTYPLALAFRDCGHAAVRSEIDKMDLYAGLLPTFQTACRP